MTDENAILDALSDEQLSKLRSGEALEFLIKKNEPVPSREKSTSMSVLQITWHTKGVIGNASLEEEYPGVIGLGDANE